MAAAAVCGVPVITGGQLDRRITIQRPTVVTDGEYGPQHGGWEDVFARVPAQVQDMLPRVAEVFAQAINISDRPARVRIRYLRGITADMRVIVHGEADTIHQISAGPAEIGRRAWIEFTIKEFSS
jgi:SPP1 family predicted phage head-tail adaptor